MQIFPMDKENIINAVKMLLKFLISHHKFSFIKANSSMENLMDKALLLILGELNLLDNLRMEKDTVKGVCI
jgi:hypothetical protein